MLALLGPVAGVVLLVLLGRFGRAWGDGDNAGLSRWSVVVIGLVWIVVLRGYLL